MVPALGASIGAGIVAHGSDPKMSFGAGSRAWQGPPKDDELTSRIKALLEFEEKEKFEAEAAAAAAAAQQEEKAEEKAKAKAATVAGGAAAE